MKDAVNNRLCAELVKMLTHQVEGISRAPYTHSMKAGLRQADVVDESDGCGIVAVIAGEAHNHLAVRVRLKIQNFAGQHFRFLALL